MVIERGESLDEWQQRRLADFPSAMQILMHLVQRATELHTAGVVHRDLKPANVILLPSTNSWTLIDVGGAAAIGSTVPLCCTLSYAAPETVLAIIAGERTVVANPAVDAWAMGVMAWELLTRTKVFEPGSRALVEQTMQGQAQLPWERAEAAEHNVRMRQLGFMREGVLALLARDPRDRIHMAAVLRLWRGRLGRDTTYRTTSQ